jgi:hypothetical protein
MALFKPEIDSLIPGESVEGVAESAVQTNIAAAVGSAHSFALSIA